MIPRTINELWFQTLKKYPHKTALICQGKNISYQALELKIRNLSCYLKENLKIKKGDRIALLMPNSPEFVISYFATIRVGAVALPLNTRLAGNEYNLIINDAGPNALIVDKLFWKKIRDIQKNLKTIKNFITIGFEFSSGHAFKECINRECKKTGSLLPIHNDLAVIMYTSGTTGRPKGAMMTHRNIIFNCLSCQSMMHFVPEDVHLIAVPLFHVTGLNSQLIAGIFQGSTIVLLPKYKTQKLAELLARYRVTVFLGVPTMFELLFIKVDLKRYDLSSLRAFGYAGAPMSPSTIKKLRKNFPRVNLHNFYGLTETSSITTVLSDRDADDYSESVGVAARGVKLKIVDSHGNDIGPNKIGELWIKGSNIVEGYFNNAKETQENISRGWLHSGDLAYMDNRGRVFLRGRKREVINRGGEKIYPIEVENAICAHSKVLESAVLGIKDRIFGEIVKAVIVPKPQKKVEAEEIKKFLSRRLADYKIPAVIEFSRRLPRNANGKVVKALLR